METKKQGRKNRKERISKNVHKSERNVNRKEMKNKQSISNVIAQG